MIQNIQPDTVLNTADNINHNSPETTDNATLVNGVTVPETRNIPTNGHGSSATNKKTAKPSKWTIWKRRLIRNVLTSLVQYLNKIDRKDTAYIQAENISGYADLTPSKEADDQKHYSNFLLWALRNHDIRNIGLSGTYGSGKSSIIRTFQQRHPEFRYINISLAAFDDDSDTSHAGKQKLNNIQQSILQQLFYHVKNKELPDSRFKKIEPIGWWQISLWGFIGGFTIFAWAIITKNSILDGISVWKIYGETNISLFTLGSLIYLTIVSIILFFNFYRQLKKLRLTKVEVSTFTAETDAKQQTVFNSNLDEIIYFFESIYVDVIILEDLDRFDTVEIFTKLREINTLINNSRQVGKHITFLYALKDEIFKDPNDRTKFFDVIIPVIPVINPSNAEEKLIDNLRKNNLLEELDRHFLTDISLYIHDMRFLINVLNEYKLYRQVLPTELIKNNLLGIILYKNLYPVDFSMLHLNQGILYKVFFLQKILVTSIIQTKKAQSDKLGVDIERYQTTTEKNKSELRAIYTGYIIERIPADHILKSNNRGIHPSELMKENYFNTLDANTSYTTINPNYTTETTNIGRFSEIEKIIDPRSYRERLDILEKMLSFDLNVSIRQKQELDEEVQKIENLRLQHLFEKCDNQTLKSYIYQCRKAIEKIKPKDDQNLQTFSFGDKGDILHDPYENDDSLLIYLIRNGYINEMYPSYISHFYGGNLTKIELNFLINIKNRNKQNFSVLLTNQSRIISQIWPPEFGYTAILNFSLLDYLLEHENVYKENLLTLLTLFAKGEPVVLDFWEQYIQRKIHIEKLFRLLTFHWKNLIKFILEHSTFTREKKNKYLQLILNYGNIDDIQAQNEQNDRMLAEYLNNQETFSPMLLDNTNVTIAKSVITKLQLKFRRLNKEQINEELFEYIYDNHAYEENEDMINLIILQKHKDESGWADNLKTAMFTALRDSECKKLLDHIMVSPNTFISNVFLHLEYQQQDSVESFEILLNNINISEDNRLKIIDKEKTILPNLKNIDSSLWDYLIAEKKVTLSWENINTYWLTTENVQDGLLRFINDRENYDELSITHQPEIGDEKMIQFIKNLLETDKIDDRFYSLIAQSDIAHRTEPDYVGLSKLKMGTLLTNDLIKLNINNYTSIKEKFPDDHLHCQLIEKNIDAFINTQDQYEISDLELLYILDSHNVTLDQKIALLKNVSLNEYSTNSKLWDKIADLSLVIDLKKISVEIIFNSIQNATNLNKKLSLMVSYADCLETTQITGLLTSFGEPYSELIPNTGKIPKLANSPINIQLTTTLGKIGYTGKVKIEENEIKVWPKKKT